jgi:hypothetical protein
MRPASLAPVLILTAALGACSSADQTPRSEADQTTAGEQLQLISVVKESMVVCSSRAVERLGRPDAYLGDQRVRIPVPADVRDNLDALRAAGLGQEVEGLEVAANRAAERAAPEAEALLLAAATNMHVQDPVRLIDGHATAMTQYFRQRASHDLDAAYQPIIRKHLEADPDYQSWLRRVVETRRGQAFLAGVEIEPVAYITDRALDGLFTAIGAEEEALRADDWAGASAETRSLLRGRREAP